DQPAAADGGPPVVDEQSNPVTVERPPDGRGRSQPLGIVGVAKRLIRQAEKEGGGWWNMGKEIIERPGALPTKKAAARPAKRSAGALISSTLTAFVQPLQVARNYGDEWCRQGRTIGVVYFPDGAGRNAVDEARKIHGRWLREFAKLSEAE